MKTEIDIQTRSGIHKAGVHDEKSGFNGHKRIAVAMSGGIDSAVAALLACQSGCLAEGVTMLFGFSAQQENEMRRLDNRDVEDAGNICRHLGIGHRVVDLGTDMEEGVIKPFIDEYLRGRTPNPCITCNRKLKFGLLLEKVLSWGFDGLATGHYAALENKAGEVILKKPRDQRKDQTYFLYSIAKTSLPFLIFPLAEYTKDEVRALAKKAALPVSERQESQDVCFIPGRSCEDFFRKRGVKMEAGNIVDKEGHLLGRHRGIGCYTIGQRGGMGVSSPFPLYVLKIDSTGNRLIAGGKDDLKADRLIADNVNWLVSSPPRRATARIRYAHRGAVCRILTLDNGCVEAHFEEKQSAISPGQSIVFYDDSTVLGGGIIKEVLNGII